MSAQRVDDLTCNQWLLVQVDPQPIFTWLTDSGTVFTMYAREHYPDGRLRLAVYDSAPERMNKSHVHHVTLKGETAGALIAYSEASWTFEQRINAARADS